MNPTFGKMKAHQLSENGIFPTTTMLPSTASAKSQNPKSQRNIPAKSANTRKTTTASGCLAKYPIVKESSGNAFANPISATTVYAQLPTGMNIAGLIPGGGRP
ncbi:hypothetical protein NX059_002660 [Plenodomus lindquistii]|nr:hypothetical protein NX059_002660 [Plenodomus lindquistii]